MRLIIHDLRRGGGQYLKRGWRILHNREQSNDDYIQNLFDPIILNYTVYPLFYAKLRDHGVTRPRRRSEVIEFYLKIAFQTLKISISVAI